LIDGRVCDGSEDGVDMQLAQKATLHAYLNHGKQLVFLQMRKSLQFEFMVGSKHAVLVIRKKRVDLQVHLDGGTFERVDARRWRIIGRDWTSWRDSGFDKRRCLLIAISAARFFVIFIMYLVDGGF
jgi:hypothetical protein